MQFIISAATLLLAASSAIASPAVRRQAEELDDNVRVILRDDVGGEVITTFQSVPSRISGGVASDIQFTTVEIDVGTDADPALRCEVTTDDNVPIVANRGENKDTTFSDATKGAWTFESPATITIVRCDPGFVADNQNEVASA